MNRWADYRRRQRELMHAAAAGHHERDAPVVDDLSAYGPAGVPLNRHSPFYLGFFGALGALIAIALWHAVGQLATVLTLLLVSLFLTLALNPIVESLTRRGVRRSLAVATVYLGLIAVFVVVGFVVIPPVVSQGTALAQQAPSYLQHLLDTPWVRDLDKHYHVVAKAQAQLTDAVSNQSFVSGVLGGILGAGLVVLNGLFQSFTVLVLTLYFLGSLPRMKQAAYAVIPASRRTRVVSLSEEIMRRTGSYAIGQVSVAAVNATFSWVMMTIVGIPYPAVLAIAVGFLGLVPMVGAGLGAVVVSVFAFFDQPSKAVIAIIYYIVYTQVENYLVMPRVMTRTISVPGAVTVVAALTGGTLLGMLGALIALPVAAGLLLIYDEVLIPRQSHQ
jgi:predicted PurR-regulated permease PerM